MKPLSPQNRKKLRRRRLLHETLDSRQLLAVDGFHIDLSQNGSVDLFDTSGGGSLHQGYASGGVGGVVVSTSNVPGQNNDHPIAVGDAVSVGEDDAATDLTSQLLSNDSDPDNTGPLAIESIDASGATGTISFDPASGIVSYDPAGAFESLKGGDSATDTFAYTINDSSSGRATATATVTVLGANDAPTITSESAVSANEGTTATISGTVDDPDFGDSFSLSASVGNVVDNGDGSWDWSLADTDGPATQTVVVTATDSQGATATTSITLTVNNVGPNVGVENATISVDEGSTATNAGTWSDVVDAVSLSADHGEVMKNDDGTWAWQAATTDGADDSRQVTITATDNDGGTASTSFQMNVLNIAPTPFAKFYAAIGNVPITLPLSDLVQGASDPGDDTVSFASIDDSGATGSVAFDLDAETFTYTPAPGFEGTDTFDFTLTDEDGATGSATATITVAGMIWFVDNSAAAGGDGSLTSPFNSFAPLNDDGNDLDDPGDVIFVASGSGSYDVTHGTPGVHDEGFRLEDGQSLVGQGISGTTLADWLLSTKSITMPAGSAALPATDGTNPHITNTTGDVITVSDGNTITGVLLDPVASAGIAGEDVENLVIQFTIIITSGGTGNNEGVRLSRVTGTLTFAGVDIGSADGQTNAGTGIQIQGGTFDLQLNDVDISQDGGKLLTVLDTINSSLMLDDQSELSLSGSDDPAVTIENNEDGTVVVNAVTSTGSATGFFRIAGNKGLSSATSVNDAPVFRIPASVGINEDAGPQSVNGFATGIAAGGDDSESGQALTFNIEGNGNPSLFSTLPAIDAAGRLTYEIKPDAFGSAQISVSLSDDGGTADGGVDTSDVRVFTIDVAPVNDAPTFTLGPDAAARPEDAPLQFIPGFASSLSAGPSNEDEQTLTFDIVGNTNPTLFDVPPTITPAGELTYRAAANQHGSATISVALRDDGGTENEGVDTSSVQTFDIVIAPAVNDPPMFDIPASVSADVNAGPRSVSAFVTNVHAGPTDESGQDVTLAITGNTNPSIFATPPTLDASGNLLFTPANVGSSTITIRATDDGGTDHGGVDHFDRTFVITITEDNVAPVLDSIDARTIDEHTAFSLQITASDINDDTLTYSLTNAPAGASITPSGLLSWTPSEDQGGQSFTFDVNVSDGSESDFEKITWTIAETNDPPVLESVGNKSVTAGDTLTFHGIEGDPDRPIQTLTYSLGSGAPAGASISADGAFSWTPTAAQVGTHLIEIIVTDNGSPTRSDSETITVTVNNVVSVEGFATIEMELSQLNSAAGTTYEILIDLEVGDSRANSATKLLFAAPDEPGNYQQLNGGPFSGHENARQEEGETVAEFLSTFTGEWGFRIDFAGDGFSEAQGDEEITIDVDIETVLGSFPDAPQLTSPAAGQALAISDGTATIQWTGIDAARTDFLFVGLDDDAGNELLDEDVAATATSATASGIASGTPLSGFVGAIEVVDGLASVSNPASGVGFEFWLGNYATFVPPVDANTGPVLNSIGARTINEHQAFTLDVSALASDIDGDTLNFGINPTPAGASINATTGLLSWTPSENQGGQSFTFDISVSDGVKTDFEKVTWTVAETNDPPVLDAIGSRAVDEGTTLTFSAAATDGDGGEQTLSYSLGSGAPSGASITSAGVFTWTPTPAQQGSHAIEIIATDDGSPAMSDSETVVITVEAEPVLASIADVRFEIGRFDVDGEDLFASWIEVTGLGENATDQSRIDLQRAGDSGFTRFDSVGQYHENEYAYDSLADLLAAHDGVHTVGIDYDGDGDHEATFTIDVDLAGFTLGSFPVFPTINSPAGTIEDTTPTITWDAISGVESFYISVMQDNDDLDEVWFTEPELPGSATSVTSGTVPTGEALLAGVQANFRDDSLATASSSDGTVNLSFYNNSGRATAFTVSTDDGVPAGGVVLNDDFTNGANGDGVPTGWDVQQAGVYQTGGSLLTINDLTGDDTSPMLRSQTSFNPTGKRTTITTTIQSVTVGDDVGFGVASQSVSDGFVTGLYRSGPNQAQLFVMAVEDEGQTIHSLTETFAYSGGAVEITLAFDSDSFRVTADGFDSGELLFGDAFDDFAHSDLGTSLYPMLFTVSDEEVEAHETGSGVAAGAIVYDSILVSTNAEPTSIDDDFSDGSGGVPEGWNQIEYGGTITESGSAITFTASPGDVDDNYATIFSDARVPSLGHSVTYTASIKSLSGNASTFFGLFDPDTNDGVGLEFTTEGSIALGTPSDGPFYTSSPLSGYQTSQPVELSFTMSADGIRILATQGVNQVDTGLLTSAQLGGFSQSNLSTLLTPLFAVELPDGSNLVVDSIVVESTESGFDDFAVAIDFIHGTFDGGLRMFGQIDVEVGTENVGEDTRVQMRLPGDTAFTDLDGGMWGYANTDWEAGDGESLADFFNRFVTDLGGDVDFQVDFDGDGSFDESFTVNLDFAGLTPDAIPDAPQNLTPAEGAVIAAGTRSVTLNWDVVSGADELFTSINVFHGDDRDLLDSFPFVEADTSLTQTSQTYDSLPTGETLVLIVGTSNDFSDRASGAGHVGVFFNNGTTSQITIDSDTQSVAAGDSSGSYAGGSSAVGGVEFEFEGVASAAEFVGEYHATDLHDAWSHLVGGSERADEIWGDFQTTHDNTMQIWDVRLTDGSGDVSFDDVELTFRYDESLLGTSWQSAADVENNLNIYHWNGSQWEQQQLIHRDTTANTITIAADSFSAFVLGGSPTGAAVATSYDSELVVGLGEYREGDGAAKQLAFFEFTLEGTEVPLDASSQVYVKLPGVSSFAVAEREYHQWDHDADASTPMNVYADYLLDTEQGSLSESEFHDLLRGTWTVYVDIDGDFDPAAPSEEASDAKFSFVWDETDLTDLPPAPTITSPADEASVDGRDGITLVWDVAAGSMSGIERDIQIFSDSENLYYEEDAFTIVGQSATSPGLPAGTTFEAEVVHIDASGSFVGDAQPESGFAALDLGSTESFLATWHNIEFNTSDEPYADFEIAIEQANFPDGNVETFAYLDVELSQDDRWSNNMQIHIKQPGGNFEVQPTGWSSISLDIDPADGQSVDDFIGSLAGDYVIGVDYDGTTDGNSDFDEQFTVTLDLTSINAASLPTVPTIVSPTNEQLFGEGNRSVTLDWNPVAEADFYIAGVADVTDEDVDGGLTQWTFDFLPTDTDLLGFVGAAELHDATSVGAGDPEVDHRFFMTTFRGVNFGVESELTDVPIGGSTGSHAGGGNTLGGLDYEFVGVHRDGQLFADYQLPESWEDAGGIVGGEDRVQDFFAVAQWTGEIYQIWDVELFDSAGADVDFVHADLTLRYDTTLFDQSWSTLSADQIEAGTAAYQYDEASSSWQQLRLLARDPAGDTITVRMESAGPIVLGYHWDTPDVDPDNGEVLSEVDFEIFHALLGGETLFGANLDIRTDDPRANEQTTIKFRGPADGDYQIKTGGWGWETHEYDPAEGESLANFLNSLEGDYELHYDFAGDGTFEESLLFNLDTEGLDLTDFASAPTVLSPSDGSTLASNNRTPTVSWNAVPAADFMIVDIQAVEPDGIQVEPTIFEANVAASTTSVTSDLLPTGVDFFAPVGAAKLLDDVPVQRGGTGVVEVNFVLGHFTPLNFSIDRADTDVPTGDSTGTFGGGSASLGGVDYSLDGVASAAHFRAEYQPIGPNQEIMEMVYGSRQAVLDSHDAFYPAGEYHEGWRIDLIDGIDNDVTATGLEVTLQYDDSLITGANESQLRPFQYDGSWSQATVLNHNTAANTITISTSEISSIVLAIPSQPLHATEVFAGDACHAVLTLPELAPIVDEAIDRFEAAGASSEQLAQLRSTEVAISNLPGTTLGNATIHRITIDQDAAGHGWFIDPTPSEDSEFGEDSDIRRIDLLTTVMHELGHILGLDHSETENDLMSETLSAGRRNTSTEFFDESLSDEMLTLLADAHH